MKPFYTLQKTRGLIYKISYDNLTIVLVVMPKLRRTYNGRLIYNKLKR